MEPDGRNGPAVGSAPAEQRRSVLVDRQALASAVAAASRPLRKPPDPLRFAGLWLALYPDGVRITGTGATLSIEVRLRTLTFAADRAADEPLATVLVRIDLFTQLVRQLPDDLVMLRFDTGSLGIDSGRFSADVRLLDPDTHEPPRRPVDTGTVLRLGGGRFWDAVTHLAFGAGLGPGRTWSMGSIPLSLTDRGRLQLLATDKDHSAVAEVDVEVVSGCIAAAPVLVPVESILVLDRVLEQAPEVELRIGSAQIDIVAGDTVVRSSIGGPPTPRFEIITAQHPLHRVTTSRAELVALTRRLQAVTRSRHDVLWIEWDGQTAVGRCVFDDGTRLDTTLPVHVTGAPFEIGLHVRVLAAMVQRLAEGAVTLEFEQPDQRVTIISQDEPDFLYYAGFVVVPHPSWR
jgi:DNA polymerase III sliding clamp (beta) subunit (PCNA family)